MRRYAVTIHRQGFFRKVSLTKLSISAKDTMRDIEPPNDNARMQPRMHKLPCPIHSSIPLVSHFHSPSHVCARIARHMLLDSRAARSIILDSGCPFLFREPTVPICLSRGSFPRRAGQAIPASHITSHLSRLLTRRLYFLGAPVRGLGPRSLAALPSVPCLARSSFTCGQPWLSSPCQ